MSWNVDAPEFVPGRRFAPQNLAAPPPERCPQTSRPQEVPATSYPRNFSSNEGLSSSSGAGSWRYSDVTATHSKPVENIAEPSEVGGG